MNFTSKKSGSIELRNGSFIRFWAGQEICISPTKLDTRCRVRFSSGAFCTMSYFALARFGYPVPTVEEFNEFVFDSICESIAGERVEPDGKDENGFPSWLRAAGVI